MKIQELFLYTNNITETEKFYSEILELTIIKKSTNHIAFRIGNSILNFENSNKEYKYHYAINIPSNQILSALIWTSKKIDLIKINNPEIIVSFDNWNAKSIYFYDNNKNIVELIAKKDLLINSTNEFSENSLLSINEIGIGTVNPQNIFNYIKQYLNFPKYKKGPFREDFIAQGFEECLFVISKNNRYWYPTNDIVEINPLKVIIENNNFTYYLDINENASS